MKDEYGHRDERGPYKKIPLAKSGTRHSPRPNLSYSLRAPDGSEIPCPTHQWRWSRETVEKKHGEILIEKNRNGRWTVYTKQYLRSEEGTERERTPESYYDRVTTSDGTREMKELFGEVVLDFPKPSRLIRDLIAWTTPKGSSDPVMDFFAGSGSTAQAVLELNAQDGGRRPFFLVQSPDPIEHADFTTIYDICRARAGKVAQKLAGLGHSPLPVCEYRLTPIP
jgi:adenine-specific DNA-methyltransferase